MFLWLIDLDLWPFDPKINWFSVLIMLHFYVKRGDLSRIGFRESFCGKTDTFPFSISAADNNKWSKDFDEKSHRRGQIFYGVNGIWYRPVGSIAVGCSSPAVTPLLTTEWFFLLHTSQQRLPMIFNGLDNPQNCPFPLGYLGRWIPKQCSLSFYRGGNWGARCDAYRVQRKNPGRHRPIWVEKTPL